MPDNGLTVRLDTGLERVLFDDPGIDSRLPAGAEIFPSDLPVVQRLDEAVGGPSLDDELLLALKPEIEDRTILIPSRWREALGEARGALAAIAQAGGETPSLAGLRLLLEEERQMRDMLDAYRTALFRA